MHLNKLPDSCDWVFSRGTQPKIQDDKLLKELEAFHEHARLELGLNHFYGFVHVLLSRLATLVCRPEEQKFEVDGRRCFGCFINFLDYFECLGCLLLIEHPAANDAEESLL